MDNKDYEIRRDYLEGQEILLSLPEEDQQKVNLVIGSLAKDPWPKQFSAKQIDGRTVRITVPIEDDEIVVIYEVDLFKSTIDLVKIKRRGPFKRAGDWLAGLVKFEPGGKP
jgi:mRNA-degrading endonuclease RelE of RelBE toxin-antitoxin system